MKYLWIILFFILIGANGITTEAAEEVGVINQDTGMYAAGDEAALLLGEIKKGARVDIISVLSQYVIVNYDEQYAYVPYKDINIDTDYEKYLGHRRPVVSTNEILITQGNIYNKSVDNLMNAYLKIPEKIRMVFENEGFKIKMTEEDIVYEAYAPYGGYTGIGQIKGVLDYERKMLYVNDEWPETVIHEMGHFVYDYLKLYQSQSGIAPFFFAEAHNISYYAEVNEREFFAEAFRLYISDPQLFCLISFKSYIMIFDSVSRF